MPDELEPTIYDGLRPVPEALNELSSRVIGACMAVHSKLGPGLPEDAYANAVVLEFDARGIHCEREKQVDIRYRGKVVGRCRLDFLVEGVLVLEIKSIKCLTDLETAQVLTYLRLIDQPLGLLINFNVRRLKEGGIKRVILSDA
jgi:GxxExxY protein